MKKLGKYELISELGRGAMGIVYRARDPMLNRSVALKTITTGIADDPDLLQRFYREAQSAGGLQHPNIVTVYDMGDESGTPFIAMELVEGQTLEQIIAVGPNPPLSLKLRYAIQACSAFDYAHKRGIVHRDIKPGNVMLSREGAVKVVDFGIARVMTSSKTQTGMLIGTFAYMSPEQYYGEHADERSDIWSFGVLLYELLSYRRPFLGDAPALLMRSICQEEPKSIMEVVPDCPPELDVVFQKLLQKSPSDRYQTMEDVMLDLDPVCRRLQEITVGTLVQQAQEFLARGELKDARDALRQALQLESANVQARTLLDKVNSELKRLLLRPKAQELVQKGEAFLKEGKIREARAMVESAIKLDANYEPAQLLQEQVQQELDRFQLINEYLEAAKLRLAERLPEAAEEALQKVLNLEPSNKVASSLLQKVSVEKAERERRLHFLEIMQRARSLWTTQDYEKCIQLLTELGYEFPQEEEIARLLETAREDQAERRRHILEQARNLLAAARHEECRAMLIEVQKQSPDDAEIKELLQDVREDEERHRKLQALAEARRLLASSHYDECISLANDLRRIYPNEVEFEKLLAAAQEEKIAQRRQEAVADARKLLAEGAYEECAALLRELALEFPGDAEIAQLTSTLREERKLKTCNEVRTLLTSGLFDKCLSLVENLKEKYPNDPVVLKLGETVLAEQAEQHKSRIMSEARSLMANAHYDEALALLLDLKQAFPREHEISKLLESLRKNRTEKQKQEKLIEARTHFAAGRFDEALAILRPLDSTGTKDPAVQKLRALIEGERLKQAKLERLKQEWIVLKALIADKKYEEVIKCAGTLLADFPGDTDLERLLEFSRVQQEQLERETLLQNTFGTIKALGREGRFREATQAARNGLTLFPQNEELVQLREEMELQERKLQTRKSIEQRVRDIKVKINRQELSEAIALAEQTLVGHGPNTAVTQLLNSAKIEFEARKQKRKQDKHIQSIRHLIENGRLDDATVALHDAVNLHELETFDPRVKQASSDLEAAKVRMSGGTAPKTELPRAPLSKEYAWMQAAPPIEIDPVEPTIPTMETATHASMSPPPMSEGSVAPPAPTEETSVTNFSQTNAVTPSSAEPPHLRESFSTPGYAVPTYSERTAASPKPSLPAEQSYPFNTTAERRTKPLAGKLLALLVAAGLLAGGTVLFRSNRPTKRHVAAAVARPAVTPRVDPIETEQRQAMDDSDRLVAAGDLEGAFQRLQQAPLVGPLSSELRNRQASVQDSLNDENLRRLRQQEEQLWQQAKADSDAGRFTSARGELAKILALPAGGARMEDARNYLEHVVPRRQQEEALFAQAKQANLKGDPASLASAKNNLDSVVQLAGARKPEAEQLLQTVEDKIRDAYRLQQDQLMANLQSGARQDIGRGDFTAARQKANQITGAGGNATTLVAEIDQSEAQKVKATQYEKSYQDAIQQYKRAAASNAKNDLLLARNGFQSIAQQEGSHALDAQKYSREIDKKLTALDQPAPAPLPVAPVAKPDKSVRAVSDDSVRIRDVINQYGQAFADRSADELRRIWPDIGAKYSEYKRSFELASAQRLEVVIQNVEISSTGESATVSAALNTSYTPKGGKMIKRADRGLFELQKKDGVWLITDVR